MFRRIHSRKAPRPDQDFLISVGCIDISPRHGEIGRPIFAKVKSHVQTSGDRIAEFDGAACAAKKR
ncbi:MAG: hypothetical protein C5B58_14320 [Acidobacteria bacterium]|nr:MAG: hypothetical protein C5B58_14320 [Acidobacteriota bacterium]